MPAFGARVQHGLRGTIISMLEHSAQRTIRVFTCFGLSAVAAAMSVMSFGGAAIGQAVGSFAQSFKCIVYKDTFLHSVNLKNRTFTNRRLVCQAREKGVGSILRESMSSQPKGLDLAYQSAANYLRSLGINNQSELTMVLDIAMNPNSVYGKRTRKQAANPLARKLTVEEDIRPVVEYLRSLGLDEQAVAGVICRHPAVLCYSVENRMQPFVQYLLSDMKLSQEKVASAIRERPNMLGLELEGAKKLVGYLAENGKSMEEIAQLLASSL